MGIRGVAMLTLEDVLVFTSVEDSANWESVVAKFPDFPYQGYIFKLGLFMRYKSFGLDKSLDEFESHMVRTQPKIVSESRGLGDSIAHITKATGLDMLSTIYTKITGQPCGCASRQEALNKLFPYGVKETNNESA
jgi:hypothetical protein